MSVVGVAVPTTTVGGGRPILVVAWAILLVMTATAIPNALAETRTAEASIDNGVVKGTISFTQETGDTFVRISASLSYVGGGGEGGEGEEGEPSSRTSGHLWHLHTGHGINERDCGTAGGHWDPTGAEDRDNYVCDAGSDDPDKACYLGDASGKYGTISIGTQAAPSSVLSASDRTITLDKILGSGVSVVVHGEGGSAARIACADVLESLGPLPDSGRQSVAVVNADGVTGTVTLRQDSASAPTRVRVDLRGLAKRISTYHLHNYPIFPGPSASGLDCLTVGGHHNPSGVTGACDPKRSAETCEVGDFSAKFGSLRDTVDLLATYEDVNIPLFGRHAVWGRSLVFHDRDTGSPRICANIGYPGIAITHLVANFADHAGVDGFIQFKQATLADGSHTETSIFTYLGVAGLGAASSGHKWHVHENAPPDDSVCAGVGPHWVPNSPCFVGCTDDDAGPTYAERCNPGTPLLCESGDMSGKHGMLDLAGLGTIRNYFIDVDLPTTGGAGASSIVNRSVVIHDDDSGAAFACSSIDSVAVDFNPLSVSLRYTDGRDGSSFTSSTTAAATATTTSVVLPPAAEKVSFTVAFYSLTRAQANTAQKQLLMRQDLADHLGVASTDVRVSRVSNRRTGGGVDVTMEVTVLGQAAVIAAQEKYIASAPAWDTELGAAGTSASSPNPADIGPFGLEWTYWYIIFGACGLLFVCIVVAICVSCRRRNRGGRYHTKGNESDDPAESGGLYLVDMAPKMTAGTGPGTGTAAGGGFNGVGGGGGDRTAITVTRDRPNNFSTWDTAGPARPATSAIAYQQQQQQQQQLQFQPDSAADPTYESVADANGTAAAAAAAGASGVPLARRGAPEVEGQLFVATHDYSAADSDELSFSAGDRIIVTQQDPDGWWAAVRERDGETGYVPAPYLKPGTMSLGDGGGAAVGQEERHSVG